MNNIQKLLDKNDLIPKELENDDIVKLLISDHKVAHINLDTQNIHPLNYSDINEYYKNGYFIFNDIHGNRNYAVNNLAYLKEHQSDIEGNIFLITKNDLFKILEREFSKKNSDWSVSYLGSINPKSTAKNIDYIKMVTGAGIIFFTVFSMFLNLFSVINNVIYLTQNILKAILFNRSLVQTEESLCAEITDDLPIYSVLIPLFREELKIDDIILAMKNLNYPENKLDIKFVIEEDDIITLRAIKTCSLPSYIHVIRVPYTLPRTKPKALNYAMAYVKGDLLTIYDAEDIPDPNQLLKAVHAFNNLPDHYACLQAKLNFYNANENILTRFFSVEYSIWFDYLLKGLSLLNLPVTLGGTSNHFKVDKLKEVGYWDAYNVTEDADLGIRLYLRGYKVHLIDSTTMEEAPTEINVWIAQRARWIKGFVQTIYIFIKAKKDHKVFGIFKTLSVYIFVGCSTYSFFCLPWLFLSLALNVDKYVYYLWGVNSIFSFAYVYAIAYIVIIKNYESIKKLPFFDWGILILFPAYFLLHTIACYRAIFEIIKSPFKWNKTPHG